MFTVYISGSRKELSLGVNAVRTQHLRAALEELTGQRSEPLIGMFDGIVEHSARIPANSWHLPQILALAKNYKQECIMLVGDNSKVWFVSTAPSSADEVAELAMALAGNEPAGQLVNVGKYAPSDSAWSYDGESYYVVC